MAINEAYNVECIEYMRSLPDKYFDLAVCDPPYGSGNDTKLGGGAKGSAEYSTGIANWNRLKGGRREKYYSHLPQTDGERSVRRTVQEILQAGQSTTGGGYYRPLHGMLSLLSYFSMNCLG